MNIAVLLRSSRFEYIKSSNLKKSCFLFLTFQIRLYLCSELLFPENETDMFYLMACRTERGLYLNLEDYRRDTCARCYFYLPPFAFRDDNSRLVYDASTGYLIDPWANKTYDADPENISHPAYATFQSDLFARKWIACCRAALDCCSQMISDPQPNDTEFLLCPRTWDGWQCWPDTPAGQVAEELCEEHIYFMSEPPPCPRFASKQCLSNGSWFINDWDSEWSNYSGCGRIQGIRRLQYFHIVTYAVSILFLLPALIIFIIYKQLQVYRITMHKNLFTALLFNDFMCIVFKCYVILDELEHAGDRRTILEDNGVVCKVLYIATKYTRMTTYMWMFCEGFYLHKLIAASFAEQKSIQMFYFIGWVFPVFPVGTFALLRWYFADEECWAVPVNPYEWVTNSPNLLSLVLNFAFLCNIIRVLVTKLRATHTNEPSQFRKAVRATLVLVPLFGLHFFLVIYRPQYGECTALEVYTFLSYSMDGLQGFLVSLIFCYLNGEIQGLVKRSIQRIRLQRSVTSSSDWRRSTRSEHLSKMRVNGSRKRGAVRPFLSMKL
ncbi:calcitonin gene-related peptide type 1 receptor-like isoform X6 [Uloborus diversus]|uniref:calcitonin gene-related peptide type 1 receptor-like isoform X3 n=1 Tax=Uloborus diversus TaxID=327109 RepID=UPI00240A5724|nr:calcitonin gene-related peptide type 1 receptor-like isoform X3 [Uloborus diversus]XP_054710654.1 calcitonin gene-related peptide type 1 receptor-like isoform X4 [Uloborus diversus]XP_054710655.1 calcitonin gene-related peptide type 1 receptor-like isoform X5 [Uloborus diversus]XP_054710656.1 calcitonin gene-related peptide type 1 receptor-like isoform X6 [Uloborus diversus]